MAESPAQTAFAEEALTHLDTLYRGALRLTRDPDQAQDLVQEAYLRALRYQHSYQQGTNMKAWLFAIMRNLFWDRFKGSRKEDVSLDDVGEFVLYDRLRAAAVLSSTTSGGMRAPSPRPTCSTSWPPQRSLRPLRSSRRCTVRSSSW